MRLKNFKKPSKLKTEFLRVLASLFTYKEILRIKDTFYALDTYLKGCITFDELTNAFSKYNIFTQPIDVKLKIDMAGEIFSNIDLNNDGELQYSEFLIAALDSENHLTPKNIKGIFDYFDCDKT